MRNVARNLAAFILILGSAWPCALAQTGSVINSPHNLSATGPGTIRASNEQQVCIFCHTPHNASPIQPLWNRHLSVAAYIPYTSSSLQAQPGQPTGTSKLCLSCHDGTIALGSVYSRNQPITMAGGMTTLPPGHKANLGTDLSDDHPISFRYDRTLAGKDLKLRDPASLPPATRLDSDEELQCTTCHDAHNNKFGKFLVMDNSNSQLCNSCHNQGTTEISEHAQCASCHQPHTAPSGAYLLRGATVKDACAKCHAGQVVAGGGAASGKNVIADMMKMSSHDHPGKIDPTKINPAAANCNDCHDSHTMAHGTAVAPNIPPTLGAISGVNSAGAVTPRAAYEYEVCNKCHSGPSAQNGNPINTVSRQVVQNDTRLEFLPSSISFHPVQAPGKSADVPSLVPGMTVSSMIYCSDCHASDTSPAAGGTGPRGPHGSNVSPLLALQYDRTDNIAESSAAYALCYKCHERSSILANQSFSGHSKHIVDAKTPCSVCHDPHGIPSGQGNAVNHAHLINFDTTIVQRDRITGRLEYQTMGDRAGTCYLTCHNVDHSPKSYPAAGAVAPAAVVPGAPAQKRIIVAPTR